MTTIKFHNVETGEVIEREMTQQEAEQKAAESAIALAAEAQKAAERAALLTKLGITEDEAKLLLS
jgi:acyl-CoA reductase-like NAD-dependent aldehyde dehydrogenase